MKEKSVEVMLSDIDDVNPVLLDMLRNVEKYVSAIRMAGLVDFARKGISVPCFEVFIRAVKHNISEANLRRLMDVSATVTNPAALNELRKAFCFGYTEEYIRDVMRCGQTHRNAHDFLYLKQLHKENAEPERIELYEKIMCDDSIYNLYDFYCVFGNGYSVELISEIYEFVLECKAYPFNLAFVSTAMMSNKPEGFVHEMLVEERKRFERYKKKLDEGERPQKNDSAPGGILFCGEGGHTCFASKNADDMNDTVVDVMNKFVALSEKYENDKNTGE